MLSKSTNFIYEITNLSQNKVDEINAINPKREKVIKRIKAVKEYGGVFNYVAPEKKIMLYNLKMVDSYMPEIVGSILLVFYLHRISRISQIVDYIHENTNLMARLQYEDKEWLV